MVKVHKTGVTLQQTQKLMGKIGWISKWPLFKVTLVTNPFYGTLATLVFLVLFSLDFKLKIIFEQKKMFSPKRAHCLMYYHLIKVPRCSAPAKCKGKSEKLGQIKETKLKMSCSFYYILNYICIFLLGLNFLPNNLMGYFISNYYVIHYFVRCLYESSF